MNKINRSIYTFIFAGALLSLFWIIYSEAILLNLGIDSFWRPILLVAGIGIVQISVILFPKHYYEKKTKIKIFY